MALKSLFPVLATTALVSLCLPAFAEGLDNLNIMVPAKPGGGCRGASHARSRPRRIVPYRARPAVARRYSVRASAIICSMQRPQPS